jgi:hypothetical protein
MEQMCIVSRIGGRPVAVAKQNKRPPLDVPQGARQLAGTTTALVAPRPRSPVIGLVAPSPAGLRARQLLQEAKKASVDHVSELQSAIARVQAMLDDVVEGGEVYTPGLNEFAVRLREELFWRSKTLEALAQKQRPRVEGFRP